MADLHDDELPVTEELVRRLVRDQLPQHSHLPVARLDSSGSSNALFRLGPSLLVRVPRQPAGSETIRKEARWLPHVRSSLPVPTSYVVAVGEPAHGYPEHWSVVDWLPGHNPSPGGSADRAALARDLAAVVIALRELEVPAEALDDPALRWYRAEPVTALDATVRTAVEACRSLPGLDVDLDLAMTVWSDAMALDAPRSAPHWLHGDLLAENLLVRDGRLAGVLDFGGLAVGDPTVDLVAAWELLDAPARRTFRELVGVDDRTWTLGRAWALALAVITFPYYWDTMPERCRSRVVMSQQVLADAAAG